MKFKGTLIYKLGLKPSSGRLASIVYKDLDPPPPICTTTNTPSYNNTKETILSESSPLTMSFSTMKSALATAILSFSLVQAAPANKVIKRDSLKGVDISHYQESFDYEGAYADGIVFAMIKATESTTYTDPSVSFLIFISPTQFRTMLTNDSSRLTTLELTMPE